MSLGLHLNIHALRGTLPEHHFTDIVLWHHLFSSHSVDCWGLFRCCCFWEASVQRWLLRRSLHRMERKVRSSSKNQWLTGTIEAIAFVAKSMAEMVETPWNSKLLKSHLRRALKVDWRQWRSSVDSCVAAWHAGDCRVPKVIEPIQHHAVINSKGISIRLFPAMVRGFTTWQSSTSTGLQWLLRRWQSHEACKQTPCSAIWMTNNLVT